MNPNIIRLIIMLGTGFVVTVPLLWPQVRQRLGLLNRVMVQQPPPVDPHLANLQARIDNLLLACEHLLAGETPQESIMYRLIEAHGGMEDPVREVRVAEWLGRCQLALANVFALRRRLLDPEIQAKRGPKLIKDWETLYITVVGSQPRVLELTDKELHILLDPIEVLERQEPDDALLARQLNHIHEEMRTRPLKVALQTINPRDFDSQGILGYIDLVEQELAEVQAASTRAAAQRLQQEEHPEEVHRKSRLMHTPPQARSNSGRRLTISERIASIREQSDDTL